MTTPPRRLVLINKPFQIKFFIWLFTGISIINVILYLAIFYILNSFITMGVELGLENLHPYFIFVKHQKEKIDLIFAGTFLVEVIVLTIFSYVFSHRVAGPIHRMKVWLIAVAAGKDVLPLSFRKNDFFAEVPDFINTAFQTIRSKRH